MKPLRLFLSTLLSLQFFIILSFAQTGKIDSTTIVTLRIDPQSARGAAVSQLFDEVKFVPLETTKESLFGNISQLKVANNKYIIFDYDTRSVLLFNTDGKFIAKIDAAKLQTDKGDKEKAQSYGFKTIEEEGIPYIVIFTNNNAQYFDFEGKFIKKTKNLNYADGITMANGNVLVKQYKSIKKGNDSTFYKLNVINTIKNDTTGYFPSFTAGWIVSDENFFKDNATINFLKMRLSYGTLGNDVAPSNAYRSQLSGEGVYVFDNILTTASEII